LVPICTSYSVQKSNLTIESPFVNLSITVQLKSSDFLYLIATNPSFPWIQEILTYSSSGVMIIPAGGAFFVQSVLRLEIDLNAFNFPFVVVTFWRLGSNSVPCKIISFTTKAAPDGLCITIESKTAHCNEYSKATTPVTCGVAPDVPPNVP
jgi:hypothetical protein